jgi:hypothetical protein
MELTHELVDNITSGNFVKATFDFKELLNQRYSQLKDAFKKEYKVHD